MLSCLNLLLPWSLDKYKPLLPSLLPSLILTLFPSLLASLLPSLRSSHHSSSPAAVSMSPLAFTSTLRPVSMYCRALTHSRRPAQSHTSAAWREQWGEQQAGGRGAGGGGGEEARARPPKGAGPHGTEMQRPQAGPHGAGPHGTEMHGAE